MQNPSQSRAILRARNLHVPQARTRHLTLPGAAAAGSLTHRADSTRPPCPFTSRSITSRTTGTTGASRLSPQIVRLRPAPHSRTRILSYSLKVTPAKHFINWQQDPQANYLARLVFPEKTEELRIEVDLVAEMAVLNPFDFFLEPYAKEFPFEYEAASGASWRRTSSRSRRRRASRSTSASIPRKHAQRRSISSSS